MKSLESIIEANLVGESVDLSAATRDMQYELEQLDGVPPMIAMQANEAYVEHILHRYLGPLILQIGVEAGVLPDGFDENLDALQTTLKFNKLRFYYRLAYEFWKSQHGLQVVKGNIARPQ